VEPNPTPNHDPARHAVRDRAPAPDTPEATSKLLSALGHDWVTTDAAVRRLRNAPGGPWGPEFSKAVESRGRAALASGRYHDASLLLEFAGELWDTPDARTQARRFLDLATAAEGQGRREEALDLLERAFATAGIANDTDLMVVIATRCAYVVGWDSGERRAAAMLQHVNTQDLDPTQQAVADAARAVVEARVPLAPGADQHLGAVARPSLAQPLAEGALASLPDTASDEVRCMVLLAWRITHSAPQALGKRRSFAAQALDLAVVCHRPDLQARAAVLLAADALEAGDRNDFDHLVASLQWLAATYPSPLFRWRAESLSATAALIDGDIEAAEQHRRQARQLGEAHDLPGWLGADLAIGFQVALATGSTARFATLRPSTGNLEVMSPLGVIASALATVRLGHADEADRLVRLGLRRASPELSWLATLTVALGVAIELGSTELVRQISADLGPWENRVAVDSQTQWCHGPVALALAGGRLAIGDLIGAARLTAKAGELADAMGDAGSRARVAQLNAALRRAAEHGDGGVLPTGSPVAAALLAPATAEMMPAELRELSVTEREYEVLTLMAQGLTNREIADELGFSVSTIRMATISIYRKLEVKGRAEAVAQLTRTATSTTHAS
jgi:DNA-binding CsgD family transcriptional regulator/tetratricopeptide (TPR) repeat protein